MSRWQYILFGAGGIVAALVASPVDRVSVMLGVFSGAMIVYGVVAFQHVDMLDDDLEGR